MGTFVSVHSDQCNTNPNMKSTNTLKFIFSLNLAKQAFSTEPETELVFHEKWENFDKWSHEVTFEVYNGEFEYYRDNRKNSYLENGVLTIKPSVTSDEYGEDILYGFNNSGIDLGEECTGTRTSEPDNACHRNGYYDYIISPIQSAKLITRDTFSFKYGKVEFEAKSPQGDWLWPAFWLMPTNEVYGSWPRSGEIDVIEMMGNKGYYCNGEERGRKCTASTLHWGPSWDQDPYEKTHDGECITGEKNSDYSTDFHKFTLEWSESGIQTYIDDKLVLNASTPENGYFEFGKPWNTGSDDPWANSSLNAPFDQEFYLIINVAVGSTNGYMPDGCVNDGGPKPWTDTEGGTASRSYYWGGEDELNDLHLFNETWTDPTFQIKEIKIWQQVDSSSSSDCFCGVLMQVGVMQIVLAIFR